MNIGILSCEPNSYSTTRLVVAAQQRGHQVTVINTLRCYLSMGSDGMQVHYSGNPIQDFTAIIPRIGASITLYGVAVVRQLEMCGVYSLNSAPSIACSRDKLHCLQNLALHNLPLPQTGFAYVQEDRQHVVNMVGGSPFVLKLLEGAQGKGVVLAETPNAATSVIDAFAKLQANVLIQRYIAETKGSDIRCFVIGDQVVAAIQRQAKAGEFRSNLHRGGTALPAEITAEERKIAIKAAKIVGLHVAGVDVLRTANGPMILEVNSSPGLKGIENATNINIAEKIMIFIEQTINMESRTNRISSI